MEFIKEEDKFFGLRPKSAPRSTAVASGKSTSDSTSERPDSSPGRTRTTVNTGSNSNTNSQKSSTETEELPALGTSSASRALTTFFNAKSSEVAKSCNQDLVENLGTYATIGTIQAILLWPISMAIGKRAVSTLKIAKFIFTPATTIAALPDNIRVGISAMKQGGIKTLPVKGGQALMGFVKDIVKPFGAAWGNLDATLAAMGGLTKGESSSSVAKSIFSNSIKGSFNLLKSFIVIALSAMVVKKGIEYINDDNIAKGSKSQAIVDFLDLIIISELSVEGFALRLEKYQIGIPTGRGVIDEKCRLQNTIIAGVLAAPILAITKGVATKGWKSMVGSRELRNSSDDITTLVQRERQIQIDALDNRVLGSLKNRVKQLKDEIKITDQQISNYYKVLTEGADEAEGLANAEKYLGQILERASAEKLHAIFKKDIAKTSDEFLQAYSLGVSKSATEALGVLGKARNKIGGAKQAIIAQARVLGAALDDINLTPKINPFASADDVTATVGASSKFVKDVPKRFEDLASLAKNLDEALINKSIKPIEALQIYNKSFQPAISRFSDDLMIFFDGVPGLTKAASQKTVDALFENIKLLNRNDDFFQGLISRLKNDQGFTLLGTRAIEKLKNLDNRASQIKKILTQEILKAYPGAAADDVARLGNELVDFNNKVGVALRQNKFLTGADIVVSLGITTYIATKVLNQNQRTDDILSWTKGNLARYIAYEHYGPFAELLGAEESDQQALNLLFAERGLLDLRPESVKDPKKDPKRILRVIYKNYIYKLSKGQVLDMIIALMESEDPNLAAEANKIVLYYANEFAYGRDSEDELKVKNFITKSWANTKAAKTSVAQWSSFHDKWTPILIKIMILNSSIRENIIKIKRSRTNRAEFSRLKSDQAKRAYINEKVFNFNEAKDFQKIQAWGETFRKNAQEAKNMQGNDKDSEVKESKNYLANNDLLKELINEQLKESRAENYSNYPYVSSNSELQEPTEDFLKNWKSFTDEMVHDPSRDKAVIFAKIMVKNLELLDELLSLIGKNQSVADEVMRQCREKYEV